MITLLTLITYIDLIFDSFTFFLGVHPSLHEFFSDFPLLPENRVIGFEELSAHTKAEMLKHNIKMTKDKKLTADLKNKKNYICHIQTVRLALDLGYRVTKIQKGSS